MDLGPHSGFIEIAYGLAILVVGGLIAWVVLDHRRQSRSLADLEARGVTRRSGLGPSAKVEPGFPSGNATIPPP
ncbi:MAG TPA: heme exporter protein CcmD [Xanthobacteraceae bacterium]